MSARKSKLHTQLNLNNQKHLTLLFVAFLEYSFLAIGSLTFFHGAPIRFIPYPTEVSAALSDTTPPTVSITYPTAKTKITPNSVLTITADASDNVGIQNVEIRVSIVTRIQGKSQTINRIYLCNDTTSPYTCDWTVPEGRNLTYLFQAIAFDTSANQTISKYVEVIVR